MASCNPHTPYSKIRLHSKLISGLESSLIKLRRFKLTIRSMLHCARDEWTVKHLFAGRQRNATVEVIHLWFSQQKLPTIILQVSYHNYRQLSYHLSQLSPVIISLTTIIAGYWRGRNPSAVYYTAEGMWRACITKYIHVLFSTVTIFFVLLHIPLRTLDCMVTMYVRVLCQGTQGD